MATVSRAPGGLRRTGSSGFSATASGSDSNGCSPARGLRRRRLEPWQCANLLPALSSSCAVRRERRLANFANIFPQWCFASQAKTEIVHVEKTGNRRFPPSVRLQRLLAALPEIAQRELQAAKLRMIVCSDGEGNVDRVSGEKRGLGEAFGHVPAQGVESHVQSAILPPWLRAVARPWCRGCGFLGAGEGGAMGRTLGRGENGRRRKFSLV